MKKLAFIDDFNKEMDKAGISDNDTPPQYWYSVGNFVLNKVLSGSFTRGVPQGRVTAFVGPSGCLPANEKIRVYRMKTVKRQTPIEIVN